MQLSKPTPWVEREWEGGRVGGWTVGWGSCHCRVIQRTHDIQERHMLELSKAQTLLAHVHTQNELTSGT